MLHPFLDIEDALVSEDNPASEGMFDFERCAKLHNYLVALGWMAAHQKKAEDLDELLTRPSFFEVYADNNVEILDNKLDDSMVSFLGSVIIPDFSRGDLGFFYWVSSLVEPKEMLVTDTTLLEYEGDETEDGRPLFLLLYDTATGSHSFGVIYDQQRHRVAFPMYLEDTDFVLPVEEHPEMWHPLETMLTKWIKLIHIGKVTLSETPDTDWIWQPYSAAQVDSAVLAFDRLTAAIEARMSDASLLSIDGDKPLFTEVELDTASVPKSCFIRSVLTRVRTPRFITIAPGLKVPHDAAIFAVNQKFIAIQRRVDRYRPGTMIPPVLIFGPADPNQTINIDKSERYMALNPFEHMGLVIPFGDHSTPAGLYSEAVEQGSYYATNEEGIWLLLPFPLRVDDWSEQGARTGDRNMVKRGTISGLFQQGFQPFGGEHHPQSLERLLDKWRELVETGIWTVGDSGVEGGIDTFRDADTGAWKDYLIPSEL
ncbi:uncharacterized protein GIQ15_01413 [Arthroderma uncinatum]|uniref:uncharacterized protein n=1 Tax=Arthroderma uncinatum TaxID=74035 RepID=UPI00144A826F|nr:uncharacterized protein GIQ15_01413 [Arthroderma uncinatum]KAF3491896.1 hypothetical protein GIQ15_01413 [Arthroderma uncinatum]